MLKIEYNHSFLAARPIRQRHSYLVRFEDVLVVVQSRQLHGQDDLAVHVDPEEVLYVHLLGVSLRIGCRRTGDNSDTYVTMKGPANATCLIAMLRLEPYKRSTLVLVRCLCIKDTLSNPSRH